MKSLRNNLGRIQVYKYCRRDCKSVVIKKFSEGGWKPLALPPHINTALLIPDKTNNNECRPTVAADDKFKVIRVHVYVIVPNRCVC